MKQYIAEICDNVGIPKFQFVVWARDQSEAEENAKNIRKNQHASVFGYLRVRSVS